jgi:hypothetical protein
MRSRSDSGGTVDQLRADIDHGRTGDKVASSDPAAVPLGADEEAAGTPVSSKQAAAARLHETAIEHPRKSRSTSGTWLALIVLVSLAIAGGIVGLMAM